MKTYPKLLIIAGSDSGGGAGIQADIKSAGACGAYSATVITAITAQNTLGVNAIEGVSPQMIANQFTAVMDDIGAAAAVQDAVDGPENDESAPMDTDNGAVEEDKLCASRAEVGVSAGLPRRCRR